jgi:regulator of nonsense transcripts 2
VCTGAGELSAPKQLEFKTLSDTHKALMTNLKTLSDVLDVDMPELQEEEEEELIIGSSISMVGRAEFAQIESPFEDEETRQFYMKLTELRAIVPAVYFTDGAAPCKIDCSYVLA